MQRLSAIVAAAVLALALGGCNSNCLQLAQKICDCQATSTERDTCDTQVSTAEGLISETSQDQANCAALLDKCDCHTIDTPQGKINCGLARPANFPVTALGDGGT